MYKISCRISNHICIDWKQFQRLYLISKHKFILGWLIYHFLFQRFNEDASTYFSMKYAACV